MPLAVMVVMVITSGIGIILQRALGQRLCCGVRGAGHAAVEPDARLSQRALRAHADAAADQGIRLSGFQESGQGAVPAAVCGDDLLGNDPAVLNVVKLELFGVTEMLEDLSVFVSDCDSHSICSFLHDTCCSLIVEPIVSAPDQELFPLYQCVGDFPPGAVVDGRYGGAGNAHLFGALLLRQAFAVKQADRLELVQRHHDRFLA